MDTAALDLDLLVALDALLAERNVTHAAARLGLSQPALSARLARLRALFGDPLFVPAARGVTPTPAALALQAPLHAALQQLHSVVSAARRFDPRTDEQTVRIAASDYTQTAVLIDFTLALRQRAPNARVALHALDLAALETQLEHGVIDLAVLNAVNAPEALHARPLYEETYVAILRKRHPAARRPLTPQRFARLAHVIVSPRGGGFATAVDDALAARGLARTTVVSASSFLFVVELVLRSNLVALVPSRLVAHHRARLHVQPPPIAVDGFRVIMAWHPRSHHDTRHKWLRAQLLAHAQR